MPKNTFFNNDNLWKLHATQLPLTFFNNTDWSLIWQIVSPTPGLWTSMGHSMPETRPHKQVKPHPWMQKACKTTPPPVHRKTSVHKTGPWCSKGWGGTVVDNSSERIKSIINKGGNPLLCSPSLGALNMCLFCFKRILTGGIKEGGLLCCCPPRFGPSYLFWFSRRVLRPGSAN